MHHGCSSGLSEVLESLLPTNMKASWGQVPGCVCVCTRVHGGMGLNPWAELLITCRPADGSQGACALHRCERLDVGDTQREHWQKGDQWPRRQPVWERKKNERRFSIQSPQWLSRQTLQPVQRLLNVTRLAQGAYRWPHIITSPRHPYRVTFSLGKIDFLLCCICSQQFHVGIVASFLQFLF